MHHHIAFFGSSAYVLPLLDTLKGVGGLKIIITRPDKPVGRKQAILPSPPKQWAMQNNYPFFTPEQLSNDKEGVLAQFATHNINLCIVADYGQLIPSGIFDYPHFKTVNIHFSRLPDLRGPSPIQWTLLRGDTTAWISYFLLQKDLDTGPILFQKEFPLTGEETTGSLYTDLFKEAANNLSNVINRYTKGKIIPKIQDHTKATFCRRLTRDDGYVAWKTLENAIKGKEEYDLSKRFFDNSEFRIPNSELIARMTRAFSPWPGVWTILRSKGTRLKILKAHAKDGRLVVDIVQPEGKQEITWEQFKRVK